MDSNSNSSDMCWLKLETDLEAEKEKRDKMIWNSDNTMRMIEVLEKDCRELWDVKHPLYRDRITRQAKHEYLACMFGTTAEEISRKIHNLRCQLNNELRKIKRRQSSSVCSDGGGAGGSGWEYFDALSFLVREPLGIEDNVEGVNLALAEFQADEEEEFGMAARAQSLVANNNSPPFKSRGRIRVAASAPPPLPPSANPLMWPADEAVPRLRPGANSDECQIFGDFVASELRTLRSDESRKKLKRMIQKAILQVGEEEDVNIISG